MTPCSRSSTPSSTSATASRAGPAGQCGPGHRRAAVAVAVGLDHRAQLGPGRPGGPAPRRCAPPRPGRSRPRPDASGPGPWSPRRPPVPGASAWAPAGARAGGLSHGPAPTARPPPARAGRRPPGPGRPAAAARPCTCAASAAAWCAGTPRARKAPMMPESTSPLPAVARAGPPASREQHVGGTSAPSGSATAVSGPFSRTTAPVAAASAAPRPGGPRPGARRPGGRTRRRGA